jgi:hypothetical protein
LAAKALEVIDKGPCSESHPTPMLFVHGANHAACCWDEYVLDFFARRRTPTPEYPPPQSSSHKTSAFVATAEEQNTSTRGTDVDHGGHFAAMEEPDVLTTNIREQRRTRGLHRIAIDSDCYTMAK